MLDIFGSVLIRTRAGANLVYFILPGARPRICSDCFTDTGLRFDAEVSGIINALSCPNCGSSNGKRLSKYLARYLIHRFFVRGSLIRHRYGSSSWLQVNTHHFRKGTYKPPRWLEQDLKVIEEAAGEGVFYYAPRYWMFGEVEPLKALQDPSRQAAVIARILNEYPSVTWPQKERLFRVRVNPSIADNELEYDSPPEALLGNGRLDSAGFPVLYCSQDIEGCVHECRVTSEDDVYVATLSPTRPLKLIDLTAWLDEGKSVTEFESLDMSIHMLFFAGSHSYPISRAIASAARIAGFDGILYPSSFSHLRSGKMPFETALGISFRRFPNAAQYAKWGMYPNIALLGRPVSDSTVELTCINRVVLSRVKYNLSYGPVITRS